MNNVTGREKNHANTLRDPGLTRLYVIDGARPRNATSTIFLTPFRGRNNGHSAYVI